MLRILSRLLLLAGATPLLLGAELGWFTRVWLTDEGLPNNHVTALTEDANEGLRITTRTGAANFDGVRFVPCDPIGNDQEVSHSLRVTTTAGEVWSVRGLNIGRLRGGEFVSVLSRQNARIAAARDGGLWIGSDANLAKRAPDGTVYECGQFETTGPRPHVTAVMEDRTGAVWIGTATNGLFRYDGVAFQKIETSYPYILCLTEDAEGNIWVGTDGGGLNRITQRVISLERFYDDTSAVGIQSVAEDAVGHLWGVTQNRWLVQREDNRWRRVTDEALRPLDAPLCVAEDHAGAIWIGTGHRAFFRWQGGQLKRWGVNDGFSSFSAHCFLPTSKGDLWVGAYNPNGVQRLHGDTLSELIPTSLVHALCEDTAGRVWIGTDSGLLVADKADEKLTAVVIPGGGAATAIMSLLATSDGSVWAGCAGGGLVRVRDGVVARVGGEQGLLDTYISQMVDDGSGWLWIGSADHGIFKVQFAQLEQALRDPSFRLRPITYGRNEGLSYLEAYGAHSPDAIGPSAVRTRDGKIWIPMRAAIAVVQPTLLREDPRPPSVRLTRAAIDGATVIAPLRVPPSHRRVDLEFSALNLSTPDNAHVRYRLDGIDGDWIEAGAQRAATYSRLAAGRYVFWLQAANFDGPWGEPRAVADLIVLPFYWQTWWFRLSAIAAVSATIAGIVHQISTRRLRARHRLLEEQSALDRERARIARDLHDDLGGSLTQVSVMLDLARRDAAADAQGKLGSCVALVRGAAQSVDEIIWAINPRNDTLPFLVDYLSQFVVEYLHAANVECSIDLPEVLPDRPVTPEMRHHLLLAVKESVTNIARHARATEVRLHVTADDRGLTIALEDNGTGFGETPQNSTADGLRNIRERMAEIGGAFEIESRPGTGTRTHLIYRWPCA